jgi:N-acetylglucosaminyldiphosphoundecaprenol N-acetyl-beta-D-mannosaminyltransferase
MKVLVAHVRYRQPGGEDTVFEAEVGILRQAGVEVETIDLRSADLNTIPLDQRARMALGYPDHTWGRAMVAAAIHRFHPDVVHFHNIYPLLGPGAITEAHRRGCATVQTLHNYRLSCLAGTHLRDGAICDLCTPGHFLPGILYGCYRDSWLQSAAARRATTRQWQIFVADGMPLCWLAVTPFVREHFVRFGAPPERVILKPNSVAAGSPEPLESRAGVFCGGRLTPEKGILELMRAWPDSAPLLSVAGEGPLEPEVRAATKANVRYLGRLPHAETLAAVNRALVVAVPSVWPEPMSLIALEAFAHGTPVVAFSGYSLGPVVEKLSPVCVAAHGDFAALSRTATDLADAKDWAELSGRFVDLWRTTYSPQVNQDALIGAYEAAIAARRALPAALKQPAGSTTAAAAGTPAVVHSHVLGMRIDDVTAATASGMVVDWAAAGDAARVVCAANVHMVMEAWDDRAFQDLVNAADLVLPDGMPTVWALRALDQPCAGRVRVAPDWLLDLLPMLEERGLTLSLYGGTRDVLAVFVERLRRDYPRLKIGAVIAPPYRKLTPREDAEAVAAIAAAGKGVLLVGIGCPKQEKWMAAHRQSLDCVMIGVGAAFDLFGGRTKEAPAWTHDLGLEWIYRLITEPRRLATRYLRHNPRFVALLTFELWRRRQNSSSVL